MEHLLKDTPGAYAQGLTLTTSMHKSFAIARHAMPKEQSDELLKVMERANRQLVESAGKKYGRARISKTVEREVVGPDGSVKLEKTTEVEYHKIRGLTAATFFHSDARGVKGDKGPPSPKNRPSGSSRKSKGKNPRSSGAISSLGTIRSRRSCTRPMAESSLS